MYKASTTCVLLLYIFFVYICNKNTLLLVMVYTSMCAHLSLYLHLSYLLMKAREKIDLQHWDLA